MPILKMPKFDSIYSNRECKLNSTVMSQVTNIQLGNNGFKNSCNRSWWVKLKQTGTLYAVKMMENSNAYLTFQTMKELLLKTIKLLIIIFTWYIICTYLCIYVYFRFCLVKERDSMVNCKIKNTKNCRSSNASSYSK